MIRRRTPLRHAHMAATPGPEAKRRAAKRRKTEAEKQRVYALVDARDGYCSRLSGRTEQLQHHHILPRSRGGKHETSNIVLLTADEHRDVTEHRLEVGGNADGLLAFTYPNGLSVIRGVPSVNHERSK